MFTEYSISSKLNLVSRRTTVAAEVAQSNNNIFEIIAPSGKKSYPPTIYQSLSRNQCCELYS